MQILPPAYSSFPLTLAPLLVQNPETSRLLDDNPYRTQYGTHGQNRGRPQDQPNPTEMTAQEREAQDQIGTIMSEYVTLLEWRWCLVAGDR